MGVVADGCVYAQAEENKEVLSMKAVKASK
jgi:hypothetical protein